MKPKFITFPVSAANTLLIFLSVTSHVSSLMNKPRKLYSGYKLLRVDNITSEYEDVLIQTLEHRDTVQLWRLPKINDTVEILVGQSRLDDVMEFLREIEVEAEVIQHDISILLNEERENYLAPQGSTLTWRSYHDYQDIISYFMSKTLALASSNSTFLSAEIIGKSELGRDIYLFKVSRNAPKDYYPVIAGGAGGGGTEALAQNFKPAIWIDAGLNGRDWLAIASSTSILDKLISGDYNPILDDYDVYIVPLINPDGYHYTRTTDRFWAKNLGVRANGRGCEGVNLDRNMALLYRGELMEIYSRGTGVAHNPCSDYYGGSYAHIEPEVTALSRAIWARREHIKLYLSLQSYSQIWLIPREPASRNNDFDKLTKLAEVGNEALVKVAGTKYNISSWEYSQTEAPGKCIDWMKQIAGIKYSYGLKVRDDGTSRGYLVPATEIQPVGDEILAALSAMAKAISTNQ